MEFVRIASITDIPAGKMMKVNAEGKDILIVNLNGVVYALDNRCPHMGGSLDNGTLEGNTVVCPRHGAQFDVKTGVAMGKAKIGPLKFLTTNVKSYEVRIDGSDVMVGF